jgi:hypothetical protein
MRRSTTARAGAAGSAARGSGNGPRTSVSSQPRVGADKAAALRRERASWLSGPDGDSVGGGGAHGGGGSAGRSAPRSATRNTAPPDQSGGVRPGAGGRSNPGAAAANYDDDDQEGELVDAFAEKLRTASDAELKHREMARQQEMSELRVSQCVCVCVSVSVSVSVSVYVPWCEQQPHTTSSADVCP